MSQSLAATEAKTKKKKTAKNLILRGGIYVVRRVVGGRVLRISTKQTDFALAEKAARAINLKIDQGEVDVLIGKKKAVAKVITTYGQFIDVYYKNISALKKVPRIDHEFLEPTRLAWLNKPIDEVSPMDCLAFLSDQKATGRSVNSIKTMMVLSSCVFNRALGEGLVAKNPWHKVPRASKPKSKPRIRVVTMVEQATFLDAIHSEEIRRLARVLFASGLRLGESRGITAKKHLDFANRFIRPSGDFTKSGKGRAVPMFPDAETALYEQLGALDRKTDDERTTFGHITTRQINGAFDRAWKKAGVERITPHDCRRTFGTRMAEAGVPMKMLQLWMGHSTIAITAEFYTHLDDDASARMMQQLAGTGKVVSITRAPKAKEESTK